jgi:hypothetical protein
MTSRARRRRSGRSACRRLWLLVSLTACSALAGCGDGPKPPALARADAAPLAALARRIAAEGPCAQRRDIRLLQQHAEQLVNARRVPAALEDTLMSGVNALAADSPPCVTAPPAQPTTTPAPPAKPHGKGPKPPKPRHDHHGHHGDGGD